ncbi:MULTISPECIES: hypothetical protein [Clostridium]|uniref:hypothetical protein n=1 Tax=Clostridium TaxID=1485 RepID=UPI00224D1CD2|nr:MULTISPECIES: hypothetical protein [Clostridium]UZT07882.1 hypothetical protein ONV75_08440 [Clostridium sp. LQ25]
MNSEYQKFLKDVYDFYKKTGKTSVQYTFQDNTDKDLIFDAIDYFEQKGYLRKEATALGFVCFKLTADCIDYFDENEL